jgi:hypothetical protein
MASKKKAKPNLDLLLQNFAGELVEVLMNKDVSLSKETEEGMEIMTTSLSDTGFLTDLDDNFLFLGYELGGMHRAINRDFIIHIALAEEQEAEALMDKTTNRNSGTYN